MAIGSIAQIIQDVLQRPSHLGEVSSYQQRIDTGLLTLPALVQELIDGVPGNREALDVVFPILRFYQGVYGRVPDKGGLAYWVDVYRANYALDNPATTTQNEALVAMARPFVDPVLTPEFLARYGPAPTSYTGTEWEAYATNFIDKLYLNVLQRAADPGGLAYWVEQFLLKFGELRSVFLATGRSEAAAALEARAIYLEQFTNSQEMKDSTAPWISAFLTGAAQDPDPAGLYTGSLFNDPPVAVGDAYQAVGGVALIVDGPGVLANDSDVDGQTLSATLIAGPGHGSLQLLANGGFTYTATASYSGTDSFTYRASDGARQSATVTVTLTITAGNQPPQAYSDVYSVNEDTLLTDLTYGVLYNDGDPEGATLTAVLASGPSHGQLTLNADGTFTYMPAANYSGQDSFTYQASDGLALSAPTTVTITIDPMMELERVSLSSAGTEGNNDSDHAAISGDGRYVAFHSHAINLVSGISAASDIFVHDRTTKQTVLVSANASGIQGNGPSEYPSISADGHFIAFESDANNLVDGDTNQATDIFVRNVSGGSIERVSVGIGGAQASLNSPSVGAALSGNGLFVAFTSWAPNLVGNDTNLTWDVFVHDRSTHTTERVSLGAGGVQGNGRSENATLSENGALVAFQSNATNLVTGDTNAVTDIFVRDRSGGVTERVSVGVGGQQANGASTNASISADGRYVVFESAASNLVAGDTNGVTDIFVHDRQSDVTTRVSALTDGTQANDHCYNPSISGDGRYVVFETTASNLSQWDTNQKADIFMADLATGAVFRISLGYEGELNGHSRGPAISEDGTAIAYDSFATNLVPGDTNASQDVFIFGL